MKSRKNLTKPELNALAEKLRGRRQELADRANVSIWTVNNTFQNLYQNPKVLAAAKDMLQELKQEVNPDVEELRKELAVM